MHKRIKNMSSSKRVYTETSVPQPNIVSRRKMLQGQIDTLRGFVKKNSNSPKQKLMKGLITASNDVINKSSLYNINIQIQYNKRTINTQLGITPVKNPSR